LSEKSEFVANTGSPLSEAKVANEPLQA